MKRERLCQCAWARASVCARACGCGRGCRALRTRLGFVVLSGSGAASGRWRCSEAWPGPRIPWLLRGVGVARAAVVPDADGSQGSLRGVGLCLGG